MKIEEADRLYAELHKKYGTSEETIRARNGYFDRPVFTFSVRPSHIPGHIPEPTHDDPDFEMRTRQYWTMKETAETLSLYYRVEKEWLEPGEEFVHRGFYPINGSNCRHREEWIDLVKEKRLQGVYRKYTERSVDELLAENRDKLTNEEIILRVLIRKNPGINICLPEEILDHIPFTGWGSKG